MEIHPPDQPVHSVRDFLIHLLMIVTGILIALGLEAALEWNHHRHQVHEAKQNLKLDMTDNKESVDGTLKNLGDQERELRKAIKWARDLSTKRKSDIHELRLGFTIPSLSTASWRTAEQFAGALSFVQEGDPEKASEADIDRFRQQVRTLLANLVTERSLAKGLSDLYAGALKADGTH